MELLLLSPTALSHTQLSHFLGAWGQTQPLPWKTGSLGGKTTGQPSTGQEAGGEWGMGGKKDHASLDHQQPRAWPECLPPKLPCPWPPHSWSPHPSLPPPGVLPAPTSSMPSQGSFKPQIRPRPPQPRASLDLCWSISPHQRTLRGNTCPVAPPLRPPWAPFSPRSSQKTPGVTDAFLHQLSRS